MATMSMHIRCRETLVYLHRIIIQQTTIINHKVCHMSTQVLSSTQSRRAPCRVVRRRTSMRHHQCPKCSTRNRRRTDQNLKHPPGQALNHDYRKVYSMANLQSSRPRPYLARLLRVVFTTSSMWVVNSPRYPSPKQPYRHTFRESLETKSRTFSPTTVV